MAEKQWVIYLEDKRIGTLSLDDADNEQDAVANFADSWLSAKIEEMD